MQSEDILARMNGPSIYSADWAETLQRVSEALLAEEPPVDRIFLFTFTDDELVIMEEGEDERVYPGENPDKPSADKWSLVANTWSAAFQHLLSEIPLDVTEARSTFWITTDPEQGSLTIVREKF